MSDNISRAIAEAFRDRCIIDPELEHCDDAAKCVTLPIKLSVRDCQVIAHTVSEVDRFFPKESRR